MECLLRRRFANESLVTFKTPLIIALLNRGSNRSFWRRIY
jgi:hypothetical protein